MAKEPVPSFEDFAAGIGPALRAYLTRMTRNAADADDLLQETLLRIARGLPRFDGRSKPSTWAYRIATNVAIDFLRRSKHAQFVEFDESLDRTDDKEETDRYVVDEMNACIRRVIDQLPPDYRAVLILFNLEGKTVAETARICGISISAAKVRIHRAKARLEKALAGKCEFYADPKGTLRCDEKKRAGGDQRT